MIHNNMSYAEPAFGFGGGGTFYPNDSGLGSGSPFFVLDDSVGEGDETAAQQDSIVVLDD